MGQLEQKTRYLLQLISELPKEDAKRVIETATCTANKLIIKELKK